MRTTLVCDAAAAPLTLIPTTDAVVKVLGGRAYPLLEDEQARIRSAYLDLAAPLIIVVPKVIRLTERERSKPSRRIVLARDGYRCQYCGDPVTRSSATMDHVKPRSKFPDPRLADTWDNVVTACAPCNHRKADRLPFECKMYPLSAPAEPHYIAARFAGRLRHPAHLDYVASYYKMDPDLLRSH